MGGVRVGWLVSWSLLYMVYQLALLPVMVQWGKQLRLLDILLGFRLVAYRSNWVGNGLCCKRNINLTCMFESKDTVFFMSVTFAKTLSCSKEDTFVMSRDATCDSRIIMQSSTSYKKTTEEV